MKHSLLTKWEASKRREGLAAFSSGDTVRVFVKIFEGEKERVQPYEGVVMRRRGEGMGESFTVRRISFGIGVERTFPIQSPTVQKIVVVKRGKVRRSRLYYLRGRIGRHARVEEQGAAQPTAVPAPAAPAASDAPAQPARVA